MIFYHFKQIFWIKILVRDAILQSKNKRPDNMILELRNPTLK